ncbi:helix-turn-helix domain-containing protein [Nonomuraea sp. NPDC052634]|uniref:helix-turn-helix transcriptional regulator n=1 Tax=Nonomuraea sp. NPDC052634 TaxID=3155813 RepID=UPI00342EFFAA
MGDAIGVRPAYISAIAALDEPTRRRLYEYVVRQSSPVSRDEAADAIQAPRTTVSFHLEKLVTEGLLEAVYERRTGRSGPGAGRPAKLYRRARAQIAVSLPDRRYETAALLLADALQEAEESGEPPRTVLDRRARELGRELGRRERSADTRAAHPDVAPPLEEPGREARTSHTGIVQTLEVLGFEPRPSDGTIALGNCPFQSLAERHAALVCGMNLSLLTGLLEGLNATDVTARLAPAPGQCCVRLDLPPVL